MALLYTHTVTLSNGKTTDLTTEWGAWDVVGSVAAIERSPSGGNLLITITAVHKTTCKSQY